MSSNSILRTAVADQASISAEPSLRNGVERSAGADGVRSSARLSAIDILRGLVIVLMALDHVRDYFSNAHFDLLDPTKTTALLYGTRWITNFCAPVFILLAGVSAYLMRHRTTTAALSRALLTRGLWLIVLEFTVITFAWSFNFHYQDGLVMRVIWAIGASMVILAALVHLPVRVVGAIGIALCVGHNLFDSISPAQFGAWAPLWTILHVKAPLPGVGRVLYPLIPWVGVMAVGYALGSVYDMEAARRRRLLTTIGIAAIAAFILLRLANGYGDPQPWTHKEDFRSTFMLFMNVKKYPPSLLYLLVTLGPALVLLAALERAGGRFAAIFQTFGRVPLFFYVLHIMLAHLTAGLLALAMGFGTGLLSNIYIALPGNWGIGLGGVYLAWLYVVITLYPACRWFADLKARRRNWWLYYL